MARTDVPITQRSPLSGKLNTRILNLDIADLLDWHGGTKTIQNAMPYLSHEDREFLMTGYTPEDWAILFPAEEV